MRADGLLRGRSGPAVCHDRFEAPGSAAGGGRDRRAKMGGSSFASPSRPGPVREQAAEIGLRCPRRRQRRGGRRGRRPATSDRQGQGQGRQQGRGEDGEQRQAKQHSASGLIEKMFRQLLGQRSPFGQFLREALSNSSAPGGQTARRVLSPLDARATGLWPIAPPFPRAWRPAGAKGRSTQQLHMNLIVVALSWLSLGCPWHAPEGY